MRGLVPLALLLGATGCGADVTEADEYLAVVEELDAARSQTDELETSLVAAEQRASALESELADRESEVEALASERDDALAEVERIRLKYDDEIRAELQGEFDSELARACAEAEQDVDAPVSDLVDYDQRWAPVGSQADLIDAVAECAADERAKTAEQREAARLAECQTVDVDAVVKNPSAFEGQCYVMYAAIWQYDSRTGPCAFLAGVSSRSHRYRYEYGEDAAFVSTSDTVCPELDGVDADDHIKVWATGQGPYRYDTAAGGTNEIPLWLIEKVELVRKD